MDSKRNFQKWNNSLMIGALLCCVPLVSCHSDNTVEMKIPSPTLLWGTADTTAYVGKLFTYTIPSDAFQGNVVHYDISELGKGALPSWLMFNQLKTELKGIPGPEDKGQIYLEVKVTGDDNSKADDIFSIEVLDDTNGQVTTVYQTRDHDPKALNCPRDGPQTVVTVVIDYDLGQMSPLDKVGLLENMGHHLNLAPEVFKLMPAGNKPVFDSSAFVVGPGNVKEPKTAGALVSWLVGCGKVEHDHLNLLQQVESAAANGDMTSAVGYDIIGYHATNARYQAKPRKKPAITPAPTLAPPAPVTVMAISNSKIASASSVSITPTKSVEVLPTNNAFETNIPLAGEPLTLLWGTADTTAYVGKLFTYQIPRDAFLGNIVHYDISELGKAALPSWLMFNPLKTELKGIPGPEDKGQIYLEVKVTGDDNSKADDIFSIEVLDDTNGQVTTVYQTRDHDPKAVNCPRDGPQTVVTVVIDYDLGQMSPFDKVGLLENMGHHLNLAPEVFKLMPAGNKPVFDSSAFVAGPGNVKEPKTAGALVSWLVGCGKVEHDNLNLLQQVESAAANGDMTSAVGYDIIGYHATNARYQAKPRKKPAITPAPTLAPPAPVTVMAISNSKIASASSVSITPTKSVEVLPTNNAFETNIPLAGEPLTLLWGTADTTAYVGKLFTYQIPRDAFLGNIVHYDISELGKAALPSWLMFNPLKTELKGIPGPEDKGQIYLEVKVTGDDNSKADDIFSIEVLDDTNGQVTTVYQTRDHDPKAVNCPRDGPQTVVTVVIDYDLGQMSPFDKVGLLENMGHHLNLAPEVFKLMPAGSKPVFDSSAFVVGPGNVKEPKTAGALVSWLVGCGKVEHDNLNLLQQVESAAANGDMTSAVGYDIIGYHATNARYQAKPRKKPAITPAPTLAPPAPVTVMAISNSKIASASSVSITPTKSVEVLPTNNAFETNIPLAGEPLTLLWGTADTTAYVGKLFTYQIPRDAFLGNIVHYDISEVGKAALPSWLMFNPLKTELKGIPGPEDKGQIYLEVKVTGDDNSKADDIFSIEVLDDTNGQVTTVYQTRDHDPKAVNCPRDGPQTVVTVVIDYDLGQMSPFDKVGLLENMGHHLNLAPEVFKLMPAGNKPVFDSSAFVVGPGNVKEPKTAGALVSWLVGCGKVEHDNLNLLQQVESAAANGDMTSAVGYDIIGYHATNARYQAKPRKKPAITPAPTLAPPAPVTVMAISNSKIASASSVSITPTKSVEVLPTNNAFETNIPLAGEPLTLLWGTADTTAYVGKLFTYQIPRDAFLGNIVHYDISELGKAALPSWLMFNPLKTELKGIPGPEDKGQIYLEVKVTGDDNSKADDIFSIEVLDDTNGQVTTVYQTRDHDPKAVNCPRDGPQTVVTVVIDYDLGQMSPFDKVGLLENMGHHLNLAPEVFKLMPAGNKPVFDSSAFVVGPGNVKEPKTAGALVSWLVGCGKVEHDNLNLLQQVESAAANGDMTSAVGYDIIGYHATNARYQAKPRKKPAITPAPTLAPPAPVTVMAISNSKIASASSVSITPTKSVEVLPTNNAFETNIPLAGEPLTLLWGTADTTAYVGKLFTYQIPRDAFLGNIVHYDISEVGKAALPSWLMFNPLKTELKGIPGPEDKGQVYLEVKVTGDDNSKADDIFSIEVLDDTNGQVTTVYQTRDHDPKAVNCPRDGPQTVVTVVVDCDLGQMSSFDKFRLLENMGNYLNLAPEVFKLMPAGNKPVFDSSALVVGPGNVKEPKTAGALVSWLVGCGKVEHDHLNLLQQVESAAANGDMTSAVGYDIIGYHVTNARYQAKPRKKPAITPAPTLAPPAPVTVMAISNSKIASASSVSITPTKSVEVLPTNNAFETNIPLAGEPLTLLWGTADKTAYVGKLFTYQIPRDAFLGNIVHYDITELGKAALPSWLMFNPLKTELKGIPGPEDKGQIYLEVNVTGDDNSKADDIFSIEVLDDTNGQVTTVYQTRDHDPKAVNCPRDGPQTVVTVVIDYDLGQMSPLDKVGLLENMGNYLNLAPEVFRLMPAGNKPVFDSSALVVGPGNVKEPKTAGALVSWLVGCGKVDHDHLNLLQQLESAASNGDMTSAVGYDIIGYHVTNARYQAKLRKKPAITPAPTLAPPTPVTVMATSNSKIASTLSLSITPTKSVEVLPTKMIQPSQTLKIIQSLSVNATEILPTQTYAMTSSSIILQGCSVDYMWTNSSMTSDNCPRNSLEARIQEGLILA